MAEVAVHLSIATLPSDYLMLTIHIPDDVSLLALPINELPHNWNAFPHPAANQKFGDDFVRGNRACCLRVPSAVTKGDFNLLINPRHADFSRISIVSKEDFGFDNRLFRD